MSNLLNNHIIKILGLLATDANINEQSLQGGGIAEWLKVLD